ncbi:MAG: ATP-binding protein, partial [Pyramidobacter sp.]
KLMEAFIDELRERDAKANVIRINFNLTEFEPLAEYHALEKYSRERYKVGKNNYVFIDEIQMCPSFEKAVNSLHASGEFDIWITGSNAFLMSSDLATLFTGRTFEIKVFPFSFAEYMRYYGASDRYTALEKYVREGGMAGSYVYEAQEDKYSYINEVFDSLIVRDIRAKHKIRNCDLLDHLTDYLIDNVGNLTSIRRIEYALKSARLKASDKTLSAYVGHLRQAFAFYRFRRYDLRGKRYLASEDKYYMGDHAFKYARLGTKNMDYGHVLENIVAIELLRRGYDVYIGKLYKNEIDFVASKHSEKIYIQVSDDVASEETLVREVTPLLKIPDAYPKKLLARTRHAPYQHQGVEICDIADWLLR